MVDLSEDDVLNVIQSESERTPLISVGHVTISLPYASDNALKPTTSKVLPQCI